MLQNRELIIRPYETKDFSQLEKLYELTWQATYNKTLGSTVVDQMLSELKNTRMQTMMPGADETTLVACSSDSIAGSAIFAERGITTYLWGMYVRPRFQMRGVGAALLLEVFRSLRSSSFVEVRALQSSVGANIFYRRHGFAKIGEEPVELAGDHKAMANILAIERAATV